MWSWRVVDALEICNLRKLWGWSLDLRFLHRFEQEKTLWELEGCKKKQHLTKEILTISRALANRFFPAEIRARSSHQRWPIHWNNHHLPRRELQSCWPEVATSCDTTSILCRCVRLQRRYDHSTAAFNMYLHPQMMAGSHWQEWWCNLRANWLEIPMRTAIFKEIWAFELQAASNKLTAWEFLGYGKWHFGMPIPWNFPCSASRSASGKTERKCLCSRKRRHLITRFFFWRSVWIMSNSATSWSSSSYVWSLSPCWCLRPIQQRFDRALATSESWPVSLCEMTLWHTKFDSWALALLPISQGVMAPDLLHSTNGNIIQHHPPSQRRKPSIVWQKASLKSDAVEP